MSVCFLYAPIRVRAEKSRNPGNPDWGTLWQSGEHFYQKFTQVCKILEYVAIYALLRSFSGWMWGRFWMTGKNLEILTWKSCFFVCISPLNFYMVVTGEFFWWIVCNNMKITLFCRFDYWTRFTHFGEHFWPTVLDWGTLLHFFQLCIIPSLTGPKILLCQTVDEQPTGWFLLAGCLAGWLVGCLAG